MRSADRLENAVNFLLFPSFNRRLIKSVLYIICHYSWIVTAAVALWLYGAEDVSNFFFVYRLTQNVHNSQIKNSKKETLSNTVCRMVWHTYIASGIHRCCRAHVSQHRSAHDTHPFRDLFMYRNQCSLFNETIHY